MPLVQVLLLGALLLLVHDVHAVCELQFTWRRSMTDAMVSVGLRQNIRWLKQQRFQTVKSRPLGRTSRPQYLSDSARLVHRQDRDGHGRWAVIAFSGEVIASCNSFAVDALAISAAGGKSSSS